MVAPSPASSPSGRRRVVLLGATGSIGTNTLRVIKNHPGRLELVGIAAGSDWKKLAAIAHEFGVRDVAISSPQAFAAAQASGAFPAGARLRGGPGGLEELAVLPEADVVLIAVIGTAGLEPALAAIAAGKELALASKEILVLAGQFVMAAVAKTGVRLLPVDSEHNAVFQCIQGHPGPGLKRIVLTASGGAFRDWPVADLAKVRVEDALKHPNWVMGPKITVDSATMANKGLELMEAKWLFGLRPEQCTAILHPQSLVHCLVEFNDGAMLAQLAPPSMTFPIQHALLHPERVDGTDAPIDLTRLMNLEFRPIDQVRFPLLRLAVEAMTAGGIAPAVYNAANEVAVAAFLGGQIPFLAIPRIVDQVLQRTSNFEPSNLASVLDADRAAREGAAADVKVLK
jgi:1-deoxy-D-xylulose-5-phosphate reductoisomerase